MKDASQELVELKKEVLETRNQIIRTDNQLKNVALDVRGFDRRFESLEKRARISGLGAQALTGLAVALAAYAVYAVRTSSLSHQLSAARAEVTAIRATAETQAQDLRLQMSKLEQTMEKGKRAENIAAAFLGQIDKRNDKEAGSLLAQLDVTDLGPLGRTAVEKPATELRRRVSDASYRSARALISAGRAEAAVDELRRSLAIDPEGRYSVPGAYLLATQLWELKRYEEVVPIVRKLQATTPDKALADELRFLLTTSLAHTGKKDEALALAIEAQRTGSRYATVLKSVQAALEQGGDMPTAASGRESAPRAQRKPDAPAKPTTPEPKPKPKP